MQGVADRAATSGNIELYLRTRAEMEALTDDQLPNFAPPYRDNNDLETWKDHSGNLLADTPSKTLVTHLYRSASRELPDADKVTDLLNLRRYGDHDLLLAKHFGLEKDGNPSTNAITARKLTRLTADIEAKHKVRYPPPNKEAFIRKYFNLSSTVTNADRAHCKKFVEDYEKYVTL